MVNFVLDFILESEQVAEGYRLVDDGDYLTIVYDHPSTGVSELVATVATRATTISMVWHMVELHRKGR